MPANLVSIILPVFNGKEFVREAIDSAIIQDHSNFELLIVNDGSTDETEDIIKSYSDSRIFYFKQENKGVSSARNLGIKHMKGDFFCFLDSDDILTPNSISSRLQLFYENPEVEFVDGRVKVFETNSYKLIHEYLPKYKGNPFYKLLKLSSECFFGPTWMIRIKKNKDYRFDENLTHCEDLLFYITISETGLYDFVDEPVYKYRKGNDSAMSDLKNLETSYFYLFNKISDYSPNSKKLLNSIKSIMFKSYLSNLDIIQAFRVLRRKDA